MKNKPEAFYTGGGIWLCAMPIDGSRYAVIDSDMVDALTIYNRAGEDDDIDYPCQNMETSKDLCDLDETERKIYDILKAELDKTAF